MWYTKKTAIASCLEYKGAQVHFLQLAGIITRDTYLCQHCRYIQKAFSGVGALWQNAIWKLTVRFKHLTLLD